MSKLAKRLIEKSKSTRVKTLDLANCGLSGIPAEVGGLVWLESLYFSESFYPDDSGVRHESANKGPANQPLKNLGALEKLAGLRTLILVAGESISPLARLKALQFLNLSGSQMRV
jgi:Leucine-rich repeat (LRR) protein